MPGAFFLKFSFSINRSVEYTLISNIIQSYVSFWLGLTIGPGYNHPFYRYNASSVKETTNINKCIKDFFYHRIWAVSWRPVCYIKRY